MDRLEQALGQMRPEVLALLCAGLQDLAEASAAGRVGPMPPRTRVTINAPRPGRDRGGHPETGEWRLRILGPGRDTARLSGIPFLPETEAQAQAAADRLEAELNGERPPDVPTLGSILEDYARWGEASGQQAPGTARYTRSAARWARLTGAAELHEHDLTPQAAVGVRDELFASHLGHATAAGYWRRWRHAWAWAFERGVVKRPWPAIRQQKARARDRTRKRELTELEVLDLLGHASSYARGRYRSLIWAMAETGARTAEIRWCNVEDFRPAPHGGLLQLRTTKTRVQRTALIGPDLAAQLAREIGARTSGPLWITRRGTRPGHTSVYDVLRTWRKLRGLEGEVDLHSIRRYAVASLERQGVARAVGKRISGHLTDAAYGIYADAGTYDLVAAASLLWLGHPSQGLAVSQESGLTAMLQPDESTNGGGLGLNPRVHGICAGSLPQKALRLACPSVAQLLAIVGEGRSALELAAAQLRRSLGEVAIE